MTNGNWKVPIRLLKEIAKIKTFKEVCSSLKRMNVIIRYELLIKHVIPIIERNTAIESSI